MTNEEIDLHQKEIKNGLYGLSELRTKVIDTQKVALECGMMTVALSGIYDILCEIARRMPKDEG